MTVYYGDIPPDTPKDTHQGATEMSIFEMTGKEMSKLGPAELKALYGPRPATLPA
jgi:hypothetical protein